MKECNLFAVLSHCGVLSHVTGGPPASFDVVVKEESGIARKQTPVTIGLPFHQGAVTNLSSIRVLIGGEPVPAQLSEACRWEDGSLRWPHARMLLNLEAGEELCLSIDTNGAQKEGGRPLVEQTANGWQPKNPELAAYLAREGEFATQLVIVEKNGAVHNSLEPDDIELEESGPIYASILEAGPLEDEQGQRIFRYERRYHLWEELPGVHIEYTFLSVGGDAVAELSDVRLEIPGMGRIDCAHSKGRGGQARFSLDGSTFSLRQECVYEHDPQSKDQNVPELHSLGDVDFSYRFQAGGQTQEGEKHPGWFTFEAAGGNWGVGVEPFWQAGPKEVHSDEEGRVVIRLAAPSDVLKFGRTRAVTHNVFLLAGDGVADTLANLMHPLVPFVDAEYVSQTGVLPYVSPPQPSLFPEYETWFHEGFTHWRNKCVEYGILHYGDWRIGAGAYGTFPSYFGHHEYDTMHSLLTHFVRTGNRNCFREGALAARHYADMDINQVTGEPRFHGYMNTADRHVEVFGMEWGHIFVDGLVDHYLLTGDRRSLRAATRVADMCAEKTVDPIGLLRGSERNVGLPLLALLRVYELTRCEKYIKSAVRLAEFIADFSLNSKKYLTRGTWWRTWMHDSSQTALSCELLVAMARYVDLTGDERVKQAFIAAIDWYVEHTWDPERMGGIGQWNRYQRSHEHPPNRISGGGGSMMLAFPMALGYKHSGDAHFMQVAWDAFAEALAANPSADEDRAFTQPRLFAPHFLALAAELDDRASTVLRTEILEAPLDGSLQARSGEEILAAEVHGQVELVDSPWGKAVRTSDAGWLSYPVGPDVLTKPGSISFWIRTEDDYTGTPGELRYQKQALIYIASELPEEMKGRESLEDIGFRNALELHIIYRALWLKVYDWRGWITTSTGASLEKWQPGQWHHVVGTWNNYNVTIHLDGEEVARQEEYCLPGGAQKRLYIGWRPMNWYGYCAWHDLRLHNSPLPPKRVKQIYSEGARELL